MNETLSLYSFIQFIENFKNKQLEKFINSEEIPKEPINKNGVLKVVRKTLNSIILDNHNDEFLVLYCINNSKKCENVSQRFNEISNRFSNSKNFKFAEYDANLNENDIFEIKTIPELIYLPKSSNKTIELKRFVGNYTSQEIIEFIQQNINSTNLMANSAENEESLWKNETKFSSNKISDEEKLEEEMIQEKTEEPNAEAEEHDGEDHDGEDNDGDDHNGDDHDGDEDLTNAEVEHKDNIINLLNQDKIELNADL